ncbi:MAG: hypothetical protein C0412_00460 [Flavobacterium sp.]|nr:hypothetical protein [Flavobacterium sp.]
MKNINILQKLIGIVYFFLLLELVKSLIFSVRILFGYNVKLPVIINGIELTFIDGYTKIAIVLLFIGLLFFIYSIHLLRKIIVYFLKNDLFNSEVIICFNKTGKSLLASSLLKVVSLGLFFAANQIQINQNLKLDTHFPLICLALFFMVLSEVFKIAKKAKEENELTI